MKLDILVITAHPDDAELSCGGTIAAHIAKDKKVGMIDLTQGEMGTRGDARTRQIEAAKSKKILGVTVRENLGFRDALFKNDEAHQLEVVKVIRKYKPDILITNAVHDRHPDHPRTAALVKEAYFLSGLVKFNSRLDEKEQDPWRPDALYHVIQSLYIKPDFVVDVSDFWDKKIEAMQAFKSQFYHPDADTDEPQTYVSTPEFMKMIEARAQDLGHSIGVRYGEGFTVNRNIGVKNLDVLI